MPPMPLAGSGRTSSSRRWTGSGRWAWTGSTSRCRTRRPWRSWSTGSTWGARAQGVPLESVEARRALQEAALVVHCTTVGLQDDALPFDPALLAPGAALAELVYRGSTGETALLRAARQRGLAAVDGVDVLVHQAIASLGIWLSRPQLDSLAPALREAALA